MLVLLHTLTNKLFAQWQGPYNVVRKFGKANDEVSMLDMRKCRRGCILTCCRNRTAVGASCFAEDDGNTD